jgi:F0F1-type ATP synthase membrane subunit b/b'
MGTDSIIVWVNLLIVVLLLLKFAVKPLMDFIKNRKKVTPSELSRLETEKEKISGEIDKTMTIINEKKNFITDAEENIARKREIIKAGIIKEAELKSELILEKAKQEAEKEIKQASEKLRAQIVNEVLDNLPGAKRD